MFENLKKEESKIDDIFADTDETENGSVISGRPAASMAPPLMNEPVDSKMPENKKREDDFSDFDDNGKKQGKFFKKFLVVIIILVVILIIAYFVYSKILAPKVLNETSSNSNNNMQELFAGTGNEINIDTEIIEEEDDFLENDLIEEESSEKDALKRIDSDGDGMSDYDEIYNYFTDHFNPDSDGDGIGDYEEIFITGTDPFNPDSDGDGYFDGQETMSCYNPLGDGAIDINLFDDPEYFADRFPELMEKCNLTI
jgi:hypothetical protein